MNELRRKALRLLARREHSRLELARKLSGLGTQEEIDTLLAQLQHENLLSDARLAESTLRARGARFGAARLRRDLRDKGIAPELIEAGLVAADLGTEAERALNLWQKKFGAAPVNAQEWARQARFLQSRGFSTEIIRRLLRDIE